MEGAGVERVHVSEGTLAGVRGVSDGGIRDAAERQRHERRGPTMQAGLPLPAGQVLWAASGYTLIFGFVLVPAGALADQLVQVLAVGW
jgi:hypothetical protein